MTAVGNPNANNVAGIQAYDDTNHQVVTIRAKNVTTDATVTPNVVVGDLGVDVEVSVSPTSNQRVSSQSGDFVDGAIATLGTEADAAWSSGSGTVVSLLKALFSKVQLITRSTVAVYSLASASQNASGNSGDLTVGPYTEIGIDINTTAQSGTNPTLQLFWERKGADGIYYVLWQSSTLTAAANTISTSVGAGMAYNQSLGITGRFRWILGGSAGPTYTFSTSIYGK